MQSTVTDKALDRSLDSALPSWFKPEKFLEPEFNAEAYVADLKRYVPLETLRGELQSHVTALKNKLVEVVNEDYNDFVSLSTKLVNVDGAVLRMQKPLLELKDKLETVRASIAEQAIELQDGLHRRQEVAAARELLELLQDTAHVMSKVEKLLGEVQPLKHSDGKHGSGATTLPTGEELESQCRLLDRVCSEVSRLHFYSAKGHDLALIQKVQPRIQSAASRLQSELDSAMRAALAGRHVTALGICLHAYSALGVPQAAEQVVRDSLLAPTVRSTVAVHKAQQSPAGGAGTSSAVLPQLLPALVEELERKLGGVLSQAVASSASSQSFDFLGGAVLPEIIAALEESLPGVFSPGVPALFHANYVATMQLVDSLESHCSSVAQVQHFRQSGSYQALLKKWNLPVYFSLRFQDIAGGLENHLGCPTLDQRPPAASGSGQPSFALVPTAAVWKGLQSCLEADVFLTQLADRFVRLAMQLLARYATWIQQGMQQRAQALEAAASSAAASAPGAQQAQQAAEQPKPELAWSEAATPDQLGLVLHDVGALAAAVLSTFVPALMKLMQGLAQETSGAVVMAFQESAGQLEGASASVLSTLAATLIDLCVVVLRQLRGIVATFRMTKRSQPDRPSHYVSAILTPLQTFLQGEAASRLSQETRAELTQAVVAGISLKYQQLADDTLSTVRKTQSSLKRLKTRQKLGTTEGDGGAGGAAPDTDKMIGMQLLLDVQEFGRLAGAVGVDLSRVEAYQQLWGTVTAPADETSAAS